MRETYRKAEVQLQSEPQEVPHDEKSEEDRQSNSQPGLEVQVRVVDDTPSPKCPRLVSKSLKSEY